ncbi:MAG TPA: hypothetical protein VI072_17335 [Polyangiaceae bacterium]
MRLGLLRKSHAKSDAQSTHDASSSAMTSASSTTPLADERPNAPTDLIRSFWSLQMTSNDDALQWA